LLEAPVADRRNWTIVRIRAEIAEQEGVCVSWSQLCKAHKKFRWRRPRHFMESLY